MKVLKGLEPESVFRHFEAICGIPHGSGNTKQISDACVRFAQKHNFRYHQDQWNNIIISIPASIGYETHPPVILQGHLDMVCEKRPDCSIDFQTDGLKLKCSDGFISAEGTTLGGDDGIAIAMTLAILEDQTLKHPPLEAVFTVDEETGMDGAKGLDASLLKGRRLINIDSEQEGVLTLACAGGARAELQLPLKREHARERCCKVNIEGLTGGHSGTEINKNRKNANCLMGEFLNSLPEFRIAEISGGEKDNAIPRSCSCILQCNLSLEEEAKRFAKQNRTAEDPELSVTVTELDGEFEFFTPECSKKAAQLLAELPNGVLSMSKEIDGLVQTSLNLGQIKTEKNGLRFVFLVRSSVNAEKETTLNRLQEVITRYGGICTVKNQYSAWEYRKESPLRDVMVQVFEAQYGEKPLLEEIHAGLECGFFCEKIPDLDAVSFGPDIPEIHTPREKLSIASVARSYRYLCSVLEQL